MFCDYQIIGVDGESVRVLKQQSVQESDVRGNVWLAFSAVDLSPHNDTQTPFRCRIINSKTRDFYLLPTPKVQRERSLDDARERNPGFDFEWSDKP